MNAYEKLNTVYGSLVTKCILSNDDFFDVKERALILNGKSFHQLDDALDMTDYAEKERQVKNVDYKYDLNPFARTVRSTVGLDVYPEVAFNPCSVLNGLFKGIANGRIKDKDLVILDSNNTEKEIFARVVVAIGGRVNVDCITAETVILLDTEIEAKMIAASYHLIIFSSSLKVDVLTSTDPYAVIATDSFKCGNCNCDSNTLFINKKTTNPNTWGFKNTVVRIGEMFNGIITADAADKIQRAVARNDIRFMLDTLTNCVAGILSMVKDAVPLDFRKVLNALPNLDHGRYEEPQPEPVKEEVVEEEVVVEASPVNARPLMPEEQAILREVLTNVELQAILSSFGLRKNEDEGKHARVTMISRLCEMSATASLAWDAIHKVLIEHEQKVTK